MSAKRIEHEPAYILHTHPWRETSYVVDVLSRMHGRVAMVAKGARRPRAALRGVLMAFQPLELSWTGQGEVKTLTQAEWVGGQPLLSGAGLMCGYYANELLMRLLPREDAHPRLFERYAQLLQELAMGVPHDLCLRRFELVLLRELGYAPTLDHDIDGAPVLPEADYLFIIEHGPQRVSGDTPNEPTLPGRVLLDLARENLSHPDTLTQAKGLMRRLIAHLVGGQPLASRRIFMELQEL